MRSSINTKTVLVALVLCSGLWHCGDEDTQDSVSDLSIGGDTGTSDVAVGDGDAAVDDPDTGVADADPDATVSDTDVADAGDDSFIPDADVASGDGADADPEPLLDLSYDPNPAFYTVDLPIPDSVPTITGVPDSYTVDPPLPSGLNLNDETGVLSGTPTVVSAETDYTITASNAASSTQVLLAIAIVEGAPSGLDYLGAPFDFPRNQAIAPQTPTSIGTLTSYSVDPALPEGLDLEGSTGWITGTPTTLTAATDYTVTGSNINGNTEVVISITVSDEPPGDLVYPNAALFLVEDAAIAEQVPTVTGDNLTFTVDPALPSGLILDDASGELSGTPTSAQATADYTVTASNGNGSSEAVLSITVFSAPPSGLTYEATTFSFATDVMITPLTPTVTGNVTSFSVLPSLPTGLSFDTTSGIISGTPVAAQAFASYTVTATGLGGSDDVAISIEITLSPPSGLSYSSAAYDLPRNVAIGDLTATVMGTVTSFGIAPPLPSGLGLDSTSGTISGTPTTLQASTGYTVTASNAAGSTTAVFTITISDEPPSGFSYPVPVLTFTENQTIGSQVPTVSGDNLAFSVAPDLPASLTFDNGTGTISGTPLLAQAATDYTVSASNANGTVQATVSIAVLIAPPTNLSYPGAPFDLPRDLVQSLSPTVSGTVANYTVSPPLPAGLDIDAASGVISGIPTVEQSATTYTVTASNSSGSTTVDIDIAVGGPVYCPGTTVGDFCWHYGDGGESCDDVCTGLGGYDAAGTEDYAGSNGTDANCQAVLTALGEDDDNGAVENITGAYGCASDWQSTSNWVRYTSPTTSAVSGASIHRACACGLIPVPPAPSSLTYVNAPFSWPDSAAISAETPTYDGVAESFSVDPALPDGLQFDGTTGEISGTPTTVQAAANYTVSATGPGGSDSVVVSITIVQAAPSGLSYDTPMLFTESVTITDEAPTVSGTVASWSIDPALPDGLSFSSSTGVISGTPTAAQSAASYTVTASNTAGSTNTTISIEIIASTYCPGITVGGFCWYYGAGGESCTTVCSARGGYDASGTRDWAGSGGTNANCKAVFEAIGETDGDDTVANLSGAYGCASDWSDISDWWRYTSATTAGASSANVHRVCACNFVPIPDPPTNVTYSAAPFTFDQAIAITPQTPTATNTVDSWSVDPLLPDGLSLNSADRHDQRHAYDQPECGELHRDRHQCGRYWLGGHQHRDCAARSGGAVLPQRSVHLERRVSDPRTESHGDQPGCYVYL